MEKICDVEVISGSGKILNTFKKEKVLKPKSLVLTTYGCKLVYGEKGVPPIYYKVIGRR